MTGERRNQRQQSNTDELHTRLVQQISWRVQQIISLPFSEQVNWLSLRWRMKIRWNVWLYSPNRSNNTIWSIIAAHLFSGMQWRAEKMLLAHVHTDTNQAPWHADITWSCIFIGADSKLGNLLDLNLPHCNILNMTRLKHRNKTIADTLFFKPYTSKEEIWWLVSSLVIICLEDTGFLAAW